MHHKEALAKLGLDGNASLQQAEEAFVRLAKSGSGETEDLEASIKVIRRQPQESYAEVEHDNPAHIVRDEPVQAFQYEPMAVGQQGRAAG